MNPNINIILCSLLLWVTPLAWSLRCHCNPSWQEFLGDIKAKGDPQTVASIGQLSCGNDGYCEITPQMCERGSQCWQATLSNEQLYDAAKAKIEPACVRYLTPAGRINQGCGWNMIDGKTDPVTETGSQGVYACHRVACASYRALGVDCAAGKNPYRHILFSYNCGSDFCNDKGFHQVCQRARK